MYKQLKILDEQLTSNNLVRVSQTKLKSQKSLFKAISLSIFYTEDKNEEVIRLMKIALFCSANKQQKNNPFPAAYSRVRFVNNFQSNQELFNMYFKDPDLNCFTQDNLQIASITFGKRVILFTISSDGYLQEQLVTACTGNRSEPPIMLAKIQNRYFCVQKQSTRSIINFIRENIVNHLINTENKIHYPNFENSEIAALRRPHKKSLSDCGDLNFNFEEQLRDKNFYDGSQNGFHEIPHNFKQNSMGEYFYHHNNMMYTDSNYMNMSENGKSDKQNINLPPNKRYCGKLKFFDQSGNYGFIVVDNVNCDLFVHYDDLSKAGIAKDKLVNIRNSQEMRFQFTCLEYDGKYKKSKKAVDLVPLIIQY